MARKKKPEYIEEIVQVRKKAYAREIPDSDYINKGLDLKDLSQYNLKSITIYKGRNTVIEVYTGE